MPTLTTLLSFTGPGVPNQYSGDGGGGGLTADAAGNLFGTMRYGGAFGAGEVFEIAKTSAGYASAPTVIVSFDGTSFGFNPYGSLIADAAGNLFGTAGDGTGVGGEVFEIANTSTGYASTPTVLAKFNEMDGTFPYAGLIADAAGNLYGTTIGVVANVFGTVFEIAKTSAGYASTPTTLASFNGTNGSNPYAGLIADAAGNLYGLTNSGGAYDEGTVFEIAKTSAGYASAPTTLASLNGTTGSYPYAGLIADAAGDLLGTTSFGGAYNGGTVFEIVNDGTLSAPIYASEPTVLISFDGADGALPYDSLIVDAAGNLFGTTSQGGANGHGEVFEIAKTSTGYASTPIVLHSFNITDGGVPHAGLIADAAGDLFGETNVGGANDGGTAFELSGAGFQTSVIALAITSAGGLTNQTSQTINGTIDVADAGLTISIYDGSTLIGTVTPAANGDWSTSVTLLPTQGAQALTARAMDATGNVATSNSVTFTLTLVTQLFGSFVNSASSPGGEMYALYEGLLGQTPSPVELENLTANLQAGASVTSIAQGLLGSSQYTSEFGANAQMSDSAFVTTLYETALRRQPDPAGLTNWTDALANGESRAAVALGIALSSEAQTDLQAAFNAGVFVPSQTDSEIARLYYGLLDRAPDASGLQTYESLLAGGASLSGIAQDILGSPEYQQNTSTGQSNTQFIDTLYSTALGRAPDPAGFQHWTTALDTGAATPASVALGFLSSGEFQSDTAGKNDATYINDVYEVALGRQADPLGLQGWEAALSSGMSRTTFDADIVGSSEFQSNVATPMAQGFVNSLYQGALGRSPEAGQPWTSALTSGSMTNVGVALGIAESAEAENFLSPKIEGGWLLAG